MSQLFEFRGQVYEFPDQATPEQIATFLKRQVAPEAPESPESSSLLRRTAGDLAVSAAKSVVAWPQTLVGLADIPTGGRVGQFLEEHTPIQFEQTQEALADLYSPKQKAAFAKVQAAKGLIPTVKAAVQNPSTIVHTAVESGASMFGGGALARVGLKAVAALSPRIAAALTAVDAAARGGAAATAEQVALARTARMLAGAGGEGGVSAGSIEEQIREASPTGRTTAGQGALAAVGGLATAGIGAMGGKFANWLGVGDIDTLLAGGTSPALRQKAQHLLLRMGKSGAVESLEELPQSQAEQIVTNLAMGRPWNAGVPEAGAQGALAGLLMGSLGGAFSGGRPATPTAAPPPPVANPAPIPAPPTESPTGLGPLEPGPAERSAQTFEQLLGASEALRRSAVGGEALRRQIAEAEATAPDPRQAALAGGQGRWNAPAFATTTPEQQTIIDEILASVAARNAPSVARQGYEAARAKIEAQVSAKLERLRARAREQAVRLYPHAPHVAALVDEMDTNELRSFIQKTAALPQPAAPAATPAAQEDPVAAVEPGRPGEAVPEPRQAGGAGQAVRPADVAPVVPGTAPTPDEAATRWRDTRYAERVAALGALGAPPDAARELGSRQWVNLPPAVQEALAGGRGPQAAQTAPGSTAGPAPAVSPASEPPRAQEAPAAPQTPPAGLPPAQPQERMTPDGQEREDVPGVRQADVEVQGAREEGQDEVAAPPPAAPLPVEGAVGEPATVQQALRSLLTAEPSSTPGDWDVSLNGVPVHQVAAPDASAAIAQTDITDQDVKRLEAQGHPAVVRNGWYRLGRPKPNRKPQFELVSSGERVEIAPGLETFAYPETTREKTPPRRGAPQSTFEATRWHVVEASSGQALANGDTLQEAVERARSVVERNGIEKVQRIVDSETAKNGVSPRVKARAMPAETPRADLRVPAEADRPALEERIRKELEARGLPPGKTSRLLATAILTGKTTGGILDPRNTNARAIFTKLTGVKLPRTIGGTNALFTGQPFAVVPEAAETTGSAWWDSLPMAQRKEALAATGLNLSPRSQWVSMGPNIRQRLEQFRAGAPSLAEATPEDALAEWGRQAAEKDRQAAGHPAPAASWWSGVVDLRDGVVEERFTKEQAAAEDHHHSRLASHEALRKIRDGEAAYFWMEGGTPLTMEGPLPAKIVKAVTEQMQAKAAPTPAPGVPAPAVATAPTEPVATQESPSGETQPAEARTGETQTPPEGARPAVAQAGGGATSNMVSALNQLEDKAFVDDGIDPDTMTGGIADEAAFGFARREVLRHAQRDYSRAILDRLNEMQDDSATAAGMRAGLRDLRDQDMFLFDRALRDLVGPRQEYNDLRERDREYERKVREINEEAALRRIGPRTEQDPAVPPPLDKPAVAVNAETNAEEVADDRGDRGPAGPARVEEPAGVVPGVRAQEDVGDVPGEPEQAGEPAQPSDGGGDLDSAAVAGPRAAGGPDRGAGVALPGARTGSRAPRPVAPRARAADSGVGAKPARTDMEGAPAGQNHVIAPEDTLVPGGLVSRIKSNIAAIRLAKTLTKEGRRATPEEQRTLQQFSGWGAMGQEIFDPLYETYLNRAGYQRDQSPEEFFVPRSSYYRVSEEALAEGRKKLAKYEKWAARWGKELHPKLGGVLTEAEWKAAAKSTLNAHYTSRPVVEAMWRLVERLGFQGGLAVEPSAGSGLFLGLTPEGLRDATRWKAVELDTLTGEILGHLYPAADVQVTGFQDAKRLGNNTADLVISNFPFGSYPINDPKRKAYSGWSIHNYFFARSVDTAKPGGLVVAITSHWTLDAATGKVREYLTDKADLVGAIRLPASAFDKSAGTEVTTDILVFRKKSETPFAGAQSFRRLADVPTAEGKPAEVNEYFAAHPEMVLGEHSLAGTMRRGGEAEYTVKPGTAPLEEALAAAVNAFPENVMGPEAAEAQGEAAPASIAAEGQREGSLVFDGGRPAVVQDGALVPVEWAGDKAKVQAAKQYLEIRDATEDLMALMVRESATDAQIEAAQKRLGKAYDAFVAKHGPLNRPQNDFLADDLLFLNVAAVELVVSLPSKTIKKDGRERTTMKKTYVKSEIFSKRTLSPFTAPTSAETWEDALAISQVYHGGVHAGKIAGLMGTSTEEARAELLARGYVFEDPLSGQLYPREEYLSGNLKKKLREAEAAVADNPEYQRNVDALNEAMPPPIPLEDIHFRLGATWLDPQMVTDFLREVLHVRADVKLAKAQVGEDGTSHWSVSPTSGWRGATNEKVWGVEGNDGRTLPGHRLVELALNLTRPDIKDTVTDENGNEKSVKNPERTSAAIAKQQELDQAFQEFVKGHDTHGPALAERFNEDYGGIVTRPAYVPNVDRYPGQSNWIVMRDTQKRAVHRNVRESTIDAHGVGTGKTAILITTAMEMRRLGTAKKPLLVVQNATFAQFAAAAKRLYPGAKILAPGEKQRKEEHRKRLFGQMRTGDWDMVIVPHSFFDRISMRPETEEKYIQEQVAELMQLISDAKADEGKNSFTAKEYQAMLEKKQARLKDLADLPRDTSTYFEDMGVDALLVDEAHYYKRGQFFTKMNRVKGIDRGEAKKSFLFLMKARHVQEKTGGKNIVLATGTPISNTMAEAWTLLRYSRPDLLREYGVEQFDDFATLFGQTVSSYEMLPKGGMGAVERFKKYINAAGLLSLWRAGADVVLNEDVEIDGVPKLRGGTIQTVSIPKDAEVAAEIQRIQDEWAAWDKLKGKEKKEKSWVPLVLFGQARKAAIDLRLIDPRKPDAPGSKANRVVEEVFTRWKSLEAEAGVQAVFCDMFRYEEMEGQGKTRRKVKGGRIFSLFEDMKAKLVQRGVPAEEIAIIHDFDTDAKRERLFALANEGKIRVVMGTSEKLGVGVNIQERLAALHHMDAPQRPMDFEQRNGRILRPGNLFAAIGDGTVEVVTYGVQNSLDAVSYDRLVMKQKFINQVLRGDIRGNAFEDPNDDLQFSFQEAQAAFSGDPRLRQLFALEHERKQLQLQRDAWSRQRAALTREINTDETVVLPSLEEELEEATERTEQLRRDFPKGAVTRAIINRQEVQGADAIKEALGALWEQVKAEALARTKQVDPKELLFGQSKVLGVRWKFEVQGGYEVRVTTKAVHVSKSDGKTTTIEFPGTVVSEYQLFRGDKWLTGERPFGNATSLPAMLARDVDGLMGALDHLKERVASTRAELEVKRTQRDKPFAKEAELAAAKKAHEELFAAINGKEALTEKDREETADHQDYQEAFDAPSPAEPKPKFAKHPIRMTTAEYGEHLDQVTRRAPRGARREGPDLTPDATRQPSPPGRAARLAEAVRQVTQGLRTPVPVDIVVLGSVKDAPFYEKTAARLPRVRTHPHEFGGAFLEAAPGRPATIYLFTDGASSMNEVLRALAHEYVAHFGLRATLGNEVSRDLDRQMLDIYENGPEDLRQEVRDAGYAEGTEADKIAFGEEMLAFEAESDRAPAAWFERAIGWLRRHLRAAWRRITGQDLAITRGDLRTMLRRIKRGLDVGGETPSFATEADRTDARDVAFAANPEEGSPLFAQRRSGFAAMDQAARKALGEESTPETASPDPSPFVAAVEAEAGHADPEPALAEAAAAGALKRPRRLARWISDAQVRRITSYLPWAGGVLGDPEVKVTLEQAPEEVGLPSGYRWMNLRDVLEQTKEGAEEAEAARTFKTDTIRLASRWDRMSEEAMAGRTQAELDHIRDVLDTVEDPDEEGPVGDTARKLRALSREIGETLVANGYLTSINPETGEVETHLRKAYLLHLFQGGYWVRSDNAPAKKLKTEWEALQETADRINAGDTNVNAWQDTFIPPDEGALLSQKAYRRLVNAVAETVGEQIAIYGDEELRAIAKDGLLDIDPKDISKALREGRVARPKPKGRFYGNLLERAANNPNFEQDLRTIFKFYTYNAARKITQDQFLKTSQRIMESMPAKDRALRQFIETTFLPVVLAHPNEFEKAVARFWANNRVLRWAGMTGQDVRKLFHNVNLVQYAWDMGLSFTSAAANATQALTNVTPIVGERALFRGYRDAVGSLADATRRQELEDMGVLAGVSAVSGEVLGHGLRQFGRQLTGREGVKGFLEATLTPFGWVEASNRIATYWAGKHFALRELGRGTSAEALAKKVTNENARLRDLAAQVASGEADAEAFARAFAVELVDKSQFRHGRENLALGLQGGVPIPKLEWLPLRLVSPYKSFLLSQLRYAVDTYRLGSRESGRGLLGDPKKALRFSLYTFALGGAAGNPLMWGVALVLNALSRDLFDEDWTDELDQIRRGITGALGLDISGSLAVNLPTKPEDFLGRYGRLFVGGVQYAAHQATDTATEVERRRLQRQMLPALGQRAVDAKEILTSGNYVSPIKQTPIRVEGSREAAAAKRVLGAMPGEVSTTFESMSRLRRREARWRIKSADLTERWGAAAAAGDQETAHAVLAEARDRLRTAITKLRASQDPDIKADLMEEAGFYRAWLANPRARQKSLQRHRRPMQDRMIQELPRYMRGPERLRNAPDED